MSNIRNVQWNEGAPTQLKAGMILEFEKGKVELVGTSIGRPQRLKAIWAKRWAWLIQPHELNWLEDMASRKTRTQE